MRRLITSPLSVLLALAPAAAQKKKPESKAEPAKAAPKDEATKDSKKKEQRGGC